MVIFMQQLRARSGIERRVSAAILVIDDFTDKILQGSAVQVRGTGLIGPPIRKNDGYFVFMTDQGPLNRVEVESFCYSRCESEVDTATLDPAFPVVKIRLQPNRNYSVPGGVTCLEGKAEARAEVRVILEQSAQPLKLLYDYEKSADNRVLNLYDPENKDLAGKTLAIRGKDAGEPEIFHLLSLTDREQGAYRLAEPLAKGYKKAGAVILPVSTARADTEGNFFLLLRGLEGTEAATCRVQVAGAKLSSREISLTPGRVNQIDLS
jgi:hypothetical protein